MKRSIEQGDRLYQFGPFCLDTRERILLREGRVVPLPAKALDTLLVLVLSSGHLVEKDVLMKEVWPDEFVEEGNLARQIFILRKAFGETTESPKYIETVPRRGYRFIAHASESKGQNAELAEDGSERIALRKDANEVLAAMQSIAVLPFETIGAKTQDEYLGLGMTDALITRLSNLKRVTVRPTSAVRNAIKGDPVAAGRILKVATVLEGSIQKWKDHIRVTVQLVSIPNGNTLWAEKFDEKFTDIFDIEDLISDQVARALVLKLTTEEQAQLAKRYTENREAYELYLRGRYSWSKRTIEELEKAVDYFRQAIAKDPYYSVAHAGLADSLLLLGLFGAEPPRFVMPQAKAAALKAIELNKKLGEAYASLAQIKLTYDWDWTGAETDFQEAIRLSPNYPTAYQWHGEYLATMGLMDEGLAELKRARDLDPFSLIINTNLGLAYYWARQYDLAIGQLKWVTELEPNFFRSHLLLGMAYESKLRHREAIAELEKARGLNENSWTLAGLGHAYAFFGERAEAEKVLSRLLKLAQSKYVSAVTLAVIHAGFKDHVDQTLEWLEKAYEERAGLLVWLDVWPAFDTVRSNAKFAELLRRIGFSNHSPSIPT